MSLTTLKTTISITGNQTVKVISTENLTSGIYFYRLSSNDKLLFKNSFVIQK